MQSVRIPRRMGEIIMPEFLSVILRSRLHSNIINVIFLNIESMCIHELLIKVIVSFIHYLFQIDMEIFVLYKSYTYKV